MQLDAQEVPIPVVSALDTPRETMLPRICIVGRNGLQNELLKTFLEEQLDASCAVANTKEDLPLADPSAITQSLALCLVDCHGLEPKDVWLKMAIGHPVDPTRTPSALFNIESMEDTGFERRAIENQIRGVFFRDERPERLAKGIQKILHGELWFSRKTTSQILVDVQGRMHRSDAAQAMLTPREKEVLIAIASGATNNEIAENFIISPHTVKTHLYNVYKKIEVSNRLEATLWVTRYL